MVDAQHRPRRPPIATSRLTLRMPRRTDAEAVATYYRDNRAHLQPWSPKWPDDVVSPRFWEEQASAREADVLAGTAYSMFVFERREPERVAGNISLTQIVRGPSQSCWLGYGLAEWAQGRGYMTEAVRAAVDLAFVDLGLHRVNAAYVPHNRRSGAVLRRAGFAVDGYARDYIMIDGRWEDHVLTSIVNPGWRAS